MILHRYFMKRSSCKKTQFYPSLFVSIKNYHSGDVRLTSIQSPLERNIHLDYQVTDVTNNHVNASPIVISHGLFGNKRNWNSLSKRISSMSGRKVVTYDAVNHGNSSHHPSMSYMDLAHDLVSLLDQLEISKALLLGHSMGGKTVMSTALMHPDRVEKLIVVDASPTLSRSMGEVYSYMIAMLNMDMSKMKTRNHVSEELQKTVKSNSVLQFLLSNLVTDNGELKWRVNLKAMQDNYRYIHSFPEFEDHLSFRDQTLFVGGSRSKYITEDDHAAIFQRFPNAIIKHVAGAGHWVHSEKSDDFLKCISDFVSV